jgi:site-specific recombinase XerD
MTHTGQTLGQLFSFSKVISKFKKGLRTGSVKSYRDTLKLFLIYVASACHRPVTRLTFADPASEKVVEFLPMIETERRNQVATRNQRLAALHTFYSYLAVHYPEIPPEAERVRGHSFKTLFGSQDYIPGAWGNLCYL